MNSLLFIALSILFYLPSLWARSAFSGKNFSTVKFWSVMAYNIFFIYLHMRFIEKEKLPFYGTQDSSTLGWISFALIFAYASSSAVPWERKPWFAQKKDPQHHER
ncbi:hypothetical protein [Pseudomonas cichorii]|uniref:hypothetical protein n=1 Tax=Pseudomonas cichorii TaxID=36746 RepID=UPI0011600781|nr:hypothetical protein [Pseudomonas cichorii]QVE15991.1 hypothetical protein KGD89_19215 [Pseudomonas cichorii]